ncbi:kelch-like protein 4 isoform X1 [Dendroctonus ponderosae]|uniref:kelch-like protein 4 isoform X1 n=1 Tax=Dendroctonus ponderosae TaxID=77166 RepID=UPI0020358F29|nr:kelch-like protein 4 isoform X1 [Dendroctonus ponderosae]
MSLSGSIGSPSKESEASGNSSVAGSEPSLPRDFSRVHCFVHFRLSLFSSGSATSQDEQFSCVGHAEHSLSCMKKYLQAGKLCDIVLIAGKNGRRVSAHRLVLSAASEYFSTLFTGSLSNDKDREITLGDIDGDVLQALVNYCYTGTIEIREDNVETLLATACLMLLHEVVEACSRFLGHQLDPSNCLGIAIFAEHQSCISLLNEANAYTNQHFMQVISNQEFFQLNVNQMCTLLSSDDLNVFCEEQVFHALMSWIQFHPAVRKKHIGTLMALVKLPFLSPAFLADQVEPAISSDLSCLKLIMEAMKWHLLPERRLQMACSRTRPRKGTIGRLMIVGGMDSNKGATTIESYDPRSDTWTVAQQMSGRRLQFGIALMSNKLLVVGGRDGLKTLNTMECLDLESGIWSQLSPMNTHRHGLGVAVLGGSLYAVGGHDGWSYLNTVERWDPERRSWQYVAPMQIQRCSAGVAVLKDRLYVVGGRDGASCLRTVECYDPYTNKWALAAPLARRKGCVGVATANGYLYVMGGQDAPANNPTTSRFDCVERYDPSTDTWTTVSNLSSKRDAIACTQFGDKLYSVGGYDGNTYLKNVEAYDPITNDWIALTPLNTGRAGACAIAVSNQTS